MDTRRYIAIAAALSTLTLAGCNGNPLHAPGQATWTGSVDDTATVYFQNGKSWVDNVTGKPVENATATFQGTLPSTDANVTVTKTQGRGDVAVTQQPARDNNYTAAVRVVDLQPDRDSYAFTLKW